MQNFLTYIEHLSNLQRLFWIFLCISFGFISELIWPLFKFNNNKFKHMAVNLVFLGSSILINAIFGLATVGVYNWIESSNFGLLNLVEFPIWIEFLLAVLTLDFLAQYVVHRLEHKIPFMWRFHTVHHSDTHLDASSGTRHHPGNYIFREIFALIAVVITGAPLAFYLAYKILTVFFAYFTHANIALPLNLDKVISYVFVSPNMHKFHHHFERPWTDTNFGNMFSFWDKIFGTYISDDPHTISYGLDVAAGDKSDDLKYQFQLPFDKDLKTD